MDIIALQLQSIELGRQRAAAIATKEYNLAMVSHSDISKMKVVNTLKLIMREILKPTEC